MVRCVCVTEAALMFLSVAVKVTMLLHNGSRRSFSSVSRSFLSSPRLSSRSFLIAALRFFVLVSLPLCLFFSFLLHLHMGEVSLQGFLFQTHYYNTNGNVVKICVFIPNHPVFVTLTVQFCSLTLKNRIMTVYGIQTLALHDGFLWFVTHVYTEEAFCKKNKKTFVPIQLFLVFCSSLYSNIRLPTDVCHYQRAIKP